MRKLYILGLIAVAALVIGIAIADEIKFSTYYPAPYGKYREFDTTGKTCIATDEWGIEGDNARVGIGTTDPEGTLHVAGGTAESGDGSDIILQAENGTTSTNSNGGNILLLPGSGSGTGADGNVGIGTPSPSATLEVKGTMKVFGAWEAKSGNTVYQAATDGFVIAVLPDINPGTYFYLYTDSSNPPTTSRTSVQSGYHKSNLCCPIKKGDYWKLAASDSSSVPDSLYWIPLGS